MSILYNSVYYSSIVLTYSNNDATLRQLVCPEMHLTPATYLHSGSPFKAKFDHVVFEPLALRINTVTSGANLEAVL